jgi:hypothetical protein
LNRIGRAREATTGDERDQRDVGAGAG